MKKILLLLTVVFLFTFNCQSNIFDWMHEDGSATGEELIIEAEGYLNAGENTLALELYEKAIPTVDGELKAKAIIGAMSAKYNLVFGEDGLFFLEAGASLSKMADSEEGTTQFTDLLSADTWKKISEAYTYCNEKNYFSDLAALPISDAITRKIIMPMKTNGAFLSLLGGMAKLIDRLISINSSATSLDDLSFDDMSPEEQIALAEDMIEAIVGGVGIDTNDFSLADGVSTNTAVIYEFTTLPYEDSSLYLNYTNNNEQEWQSLKNSLATAGNWDDTNKDCETGGLNIHDFFSSSTETTDTKEICKKDGKYIFYSDSGDDSSFLSDLMMANANNGTGMDSLQEQLFSSLIGILYQ